MPSCISRGRAAEVIRPNAPVEAFHALGARNCVWLNALKTSQRNSSREDFLEFCALVESTPATIAQDLKNLSHLT